jgi:hypothetical protein
LASRSKRANQLEEDIEEPQYQEPQVSPGAAHIDRGRTISNPGNYEASSSTSSDGGSNKGGGGAKQSGQQKVVRVARLGGDNLSVEEDDNEDDSEYEKSDSEVVITAEGDWSAMRKRHIFDQQAEALTLIHRQMEGTGMRETIDMKRERVATIARTILFRKVKFCTPDQMTSSGGVARKIYKHMNYDEPKLFESDWDSWIGKHVRNTINEKRSAVTQAIHKAIVRGKLLPVFACIDFFS